MRKRLPIIFAALLAALLIAVPLRADDPLTIPVYFDTTDPTGDSLDYVDVTLDGIRKITYAYAGHFGFEKVRLGKHSVTFEREGYYSKKIDFTLTEEDYLIGGYREAVTLYPNRSTAKIHTRDAVTGDTLDYVDVTVAGQFKNYAYNGDFSFFDVPDGTHIVSAVRPGYYSQTAPITINGGVGEITINLRPDNAKVIINVIDENGDTLDHETVSVAGQSKNYAYNGHFEFSGVPDGTYTATIERDGYYTQTAEITVEGRDTETTVVLYNTASKLTVYTVDENGDNLDYVDVSVAGQSKNYGYPGRFEFTGIPDGTHIVHTEKPGYYPCDTEVYISGADKEITVVLYNDNVTFTANVKNAKGETMDYTDVAIAGQSKTYGYPGRFEFSGVPDGTQTLTLNKDGYNPVIYKAAIQGTSQTKDFTLYKPTGTVMGFWYNPQYDVIDLTLEPVRSGTPYYAYGSKSNFVFNNVENGSYRVKVFGYQVGNVVVNGDTVNAESFGGPGIAGYARDCYGNPIEGVTVTCGDVTATTDGSGLYMMDKPNGTYTVTFTKSGYTTKSDTAVVDNCYDWLCATLATSETLVYGYITDSKGVAIEGATVTCGSVTATTGKDGAYKMTVPNGSRTITASKAKFYNNSVTLNIPADSEPLFTNISLTTNQGVIYGYVTNPDGAPIKGAAVKIGNNTFATTATDGSYAIVGASDSAYTLRFSAEGYIDNTATARVAGNDVKVDITLAYANGAVCGYIRDTHNKYIEGATVTVGTKSATTDAYGWYSVPMPNGTYTINATAAGFGSASGSASVNGETVHCDLVLAATSAKVSGYVRNTNNLEVAGATVKIGSATVTTDAHGWYEAVVNSGTYTLTAAAEGYKAYSRALKVESDDITCNINLIAADENVETTTLAACVRNEFDGGVFRFENLTVTAVFDECIYATDGVRGVKVVGAGITGGKFDLVGAIRTGADGERYIDADSVIVTDPSAKVRPVFVNWNAVGGNNFGRQKGAKDTRGVNNIGMFVKSMGVVGKEIIVGSGSSYRNGDCLVVTGIVTLDDNGNSAIRMTGVEKVN